MRIRPLRNYVNCSKAYSPSIRFDAAVLVQSKMDWQIEMMIYKKTREACLQVIGDLWQIGAAIK